MTALALPLTGLVTLAMLLVYLWTGMLVGQGRRTHGLKVPATNGPDAFNRIYRAHSNTLEQLVLMLPAMWLFAVWVTDQWAAVLGLIWMAGRVFYVTSYIKDAEARGPGFLVGFLSFAIAFLGAAIQMLRVLL